MADPTVLDRGLYTEAEAARLLQVSPSTLHYWLEGGVRRGKTYPPIIRQTATGSRIVTWAEFVEAALLRCYRRDLRVPMPDLRAFIDRLRSQFNVPYPLAHERPLVSGRTLVLAAQDDVKLSDDLWLVVESRGQLLLTPTGEEFLRRVSWSDDLAVAWRPAIEPASPVRIDPLMRSGRPNVGGISTEVLWEHVEAGEDVEEVAHAFGVTPGEVRWALAYENAARAA